MGPLLFTTVWGDQPAGKVVIICPGPFDPKAWFLKTTLQTKLTKIAIAVKIHLILMVFTRISMGIFMGYVSSLKTILGVFLPPMNEKYDIVKLGIISPIFGVKIKND